MIFSIQIVYNDGQDLIVQIPVPEYANFFKSLNQGAVFWDAEKTQGFWTSMANVRYMRIVSKGDNTDEAKQIASCETSCVGNGSANSPEPQAACSIASEECPA